MLQQRQQQRFESHITPYHETAGTRVYQWTAEIILQVGEQEIVIPCHEDDYERASDWSRDLHLLLAKAGSIRIRARGEQRGNGAA